MKMKENKYRYAVYRSNRNAPGTSLHSKHMKKENALKAKIKEQNFSGKPAFIRKI